MLKLGGSFVIGRDRIILPVTTKVLLLLAISFTFTEYAMSRQSIVRIISEGWREGMFSSGSAGLLLPTGW